jgi:hypothetical protein
MRFGKPNQQSEDRKLGSTFCALESPRWSQMDQDREDLVALESIEKPIGIIWLDILQSSTKNLAPD